MGSDTVWSPERNAPTLIFLPSTLAPPSVAPNVIMITWLWSFRVSVGNVTFPDLAVVAPEDQTMLLKSTTMALYISAAGKAAELGEAGRFRVGMYTLKSLL